jgi:rhomboid protease GluP
MGPPAELIAQHLLADGFVEGGVEEAQQLAPACDRLLTRHGMSLEIVCIVDREQDATRHFVADPLALQTVARACYKHSSTRLYGVRLPCTVRVIEVGPDASAPENRSGLEKLALAARNFETFFFSGWTVDRARGVVWSTQPLNGLFAGRRNLERILRDPRPPPVPTAATLNDRFPITTALLIAVLVLAFVIETESGHVGGLLGFDLATLIALGGESRDLVLGAGEWHRVLSAALLHADLLHLVINCIALYLAGAFVERLVGWTWLLALFLAGTLGGAALSLALNPPDIVSIGASSAIMGLLAAGLILSGRLAAGKARSLARNNLAGFLIPRLSRWRRPLISVGRSTLPVASAARSPARRWARRCFGSGAGPSRDRRGASDAGSRPHGSSCSLLRRCGSESSIRAMHNSATWRRRKRCRRSSWSRRPHRRG